MTREKLNLRLLIFYLKIYIKNLTKLLTPKKKNSALEFASSIYIPRTYELHISNFFVLIRTISQNFGFKLCVRAVPDLQYRLQSMCQYYRNNV